MTGEPHISQEDLAIFAIESLTNEGATPVRVHLRECALCQEELSKFTETLSLVAMSVDQYPISAGARQRFLDRIAADEAETAETRQAQVESSNNITIDTRLRRARILLWTSWLALAALILVSVSLELEVRSLKDQRDQQAALLDQEKAANGRAQAVLELLNAPTAVNVVLRAPKSPPQPSAKATYLRSTGSLILEANNLQPVQENKTYELWLIPASGSPIPAGIFRPDASGNASVILPNLAKGVEAKAFGVTVEPAGGSASPTLPIVLVGAAPNQGE